MQAAAQVLVTEGFERATTNRIAEVAGVSVGTLYQYFGDKLEVFDAVLEEHLAAIVAAAQQAIADAAGAPRAVQVQRLVAAATGAATARPELLRRLHGIPDTAFDDRLRAARQAAGAVLAAWLADQPDVAPHLDHQLAARLITDLGEGLLLGLSRDDDVDRLATEAAVMVDAYLGAARVRVAGAGPPAVP